MPLNPSRRRRLATLAILPMTLAALSSASAAAASEPLGTQLSIAHRGASQYVPEHTLLAYDMAMAMDVDMLECDLQLSSDEVLVCVHDDTVDRTSGTTAPSGST
jgi:glycerophosphoryl diester phosphodiesterase